MDDDLQNALEKALFERLTSQITGAQVAQHVTEDAASPLVIIGEITDEENGSKNSSLTRFEFDIVTEVRAKGRKGLNSLQRQVRRALHEWRPTDTAEVLFGQIKILTKAGLMGPDGATYFGSQRFWVFVQAA